jgi:hypothetical protein
MPASMEPTSPPEDLEVIRRVVAASRCERARTGHVHVLWGIIVVLGIGLHAAGVHFGWPYVSLLWPALALAGAAYSLVEGRKLAREAAITLGGRVEGDMWEATGLAMIVAAFLGPLSGAIPGEQVVSVLALLVGVAVVTSGSVYRYRFVKVAGYLFILGGAGSFFLPWPWPHLVFGGLLVVGYILPGIKMIRMARQPARG